MDATSRRATTWLLRMVAAASALVPPVRAEASTSGEATAVIFSTPSGNIRCYAGFSTECMIVESDYAPAPEEDCGQTGDWIGTSFVLTRDGAERGTCRSDTPFTEEPPVLDYGTTVVLPESWCRSEESGVTCARLDADHELFVSRATFELR